MSISSSAVRCKHRREIDDYCASCESERIASAVAAERERCASLVSMASVKSPSPVDGLGGLLFSEMNETAQTAIHGACQSLAAAIREGKP